MVGSGVSLKMDGKTGKEKRNLGGGPEQNHINRRWSRLPPAESALWNYCTNMHLGPRAGRPMITVAVTDQPQIAVLYGEDTVHVTSKTLPRN